MGSTWNGNYTPTNQDFWNVVADMQKMAVNNNRIVPAYSKAERDGLATVAPNNVIPDGTVVCRMDRNGAFDVFVDGAWVEGDADWVNFEYKAGYSAGTPGQMAYKIAGSTLHIKGGATGEFPQNIYVQPSNTLIPARFRPAASQYIGTAALGGRSGVIQISQNGYIQLVTSSSVGTGGSFWISANSTMPLT